MDSERLRAIAEDPRYRRLVRRRGRFAWSLTGVMLAAYFGYVLLIAFDKPFLARPLVSGGATSLGIPIGLGVILLAILLTGLYVRRANREYDPMIAEIVAEAGE